MSEDKGKEHFCLYPQFCEKCSYEKDISSSYIINPESSEESVDNEQFEYYKFVSRLRHKFEERWQELYYYYKEDGRDANIKISNILYDIFDDIESIEFEQIYNAKNITLKNH